MRARVLVCVAIVVASLFVAVVSTTGEWEARDDGKVTPATAGPAVPIDLGAGR